ncbi:MAG: hypothetical protein GEV28_12590 [Actinophytocola sp.]|uniref:hypothetical protein n=1 Tax=Actinophytocola sp. TaxID=1872138 RepID=UPI00132B3B7E|nr:hypothetical protein [Actinophytocola sp.]MPZ81177.1 hypothetical protein [Actinophytocola sp.]
MTRPGWLRARATPRLEELPENTWRATGQVLVVALPRMIRNTLVPSLTFLVMSNLLGIELGAVLALLVAGGLYYLDRRAGRGFVAGMVMAFIVLSAAVAVISRELSLFFLPVAAVDVVMATFCLTSVLAGKPLFAAAANDFVTMPAASQNSTVYQRTAKITTLLGMGYFLTRVLVRIGAFLVLPEGWFIAVAIILELVGDAVLITICVQLNVRNTWHPEFVATTWGPAGMPRPAVAGKGTA